MNNFLSPPFSFRSISATVTMLILIVFIWGLPSASLIAQELNLTVAVVNEDATPIAYAMVVAVDTGGKKTLTFEQSDEKGLAKLRLALEGHYELRVNALGYENSSDLIGTITQDSILTITLVGRENLLGEVVVRDTLPPISYRPDTVIYNAKTFYTGRERKLKDLVDKLPGLSVDDDLNVTYKGQAVTTLLVEDKPFFGGEPELALKGIPADAIGRIEVLEDYKPLGFSLDAYGRKKVALNVLLREEKKNVYFGEATASAGLPGSYLGRADAFRFSKRTNAYTTGGVNNVNRELLSFKSTLRLLGGGLGIFTDDFHNLNELLLQTLPPANPRKVINSLAAFGLNHTLSKRTQVNFYALLPQNDYQTKRAQLTRLQVEGSPILTESRATQSDFLDQTKLLQLHWGTKLSKNQIIKGDLGYNQFTNDKMDVENYLSNFASRESQLDVARTNTRLSGRLGYARTMEKGHALAASIEAAGVKSKNELSLNSDQPFLNGVLGQGAEGVIGLQQNDDSHGTDLIGKTKYTHRIHRRWIILTGLSWKKKMSKRDVKNSAQFNEQFSTNLIEQQAKIGISFKQKNLSGSITIRRKNMTWKPPESDQTNEGYWLPEIQLDARLSASSTLEFHLTREAAYTNIANFFSGILVEDPYNYRIGNDGLSPLVSRNASLSYRYSNPLKHLVLGLRSGVNQYERPQIVTAFSLNGLIRSNQLITAEQTNTNWWVRAYGEHSGKYVKSIGRLSWQRQNRLTVSEGIFYLSGVESQQVSGSWQRTFGKSLDLKIQGELTRSSFEAIERNINYSISSIAAASWQAGSLITDFTVEYNLYNFTKNKLSSGTLAIDLIYSLDKSPWALNLLAAAPLGAAQNNLFSQTNFAYQELTYQTLPAYILLGASWQF
jgi:hypothetical protein